MLFINDIVQNINVGLPSMKCDYVFVVVVVRRCCCCVAKSPEVLQSILHDIESYCTLWDLKINTRKTKAMIFEKGRHAHFDFYLDNVKLEIITSFKYLGIHTTCVFCSAFMLFFTF